MIISKLKMKKVSKKEKEENIIINKDTKKEKEINNQIYFFHIT